MRPEDCGMDTPVWCLLCGGPAVVVFADVGDEVKVECLKCGLYDAYPQDLAFRPDVTEQVEP